MRGTRNEDANWPSLIPGDACMDCIGAKHRNNVASPDPNGSESDVTVAAGVRSLIQVNARLSDLEAAVLQSMRCAGRQFIDYCETTGVPRRDYVTVIQTAAQ